MEITVQVKHVFGNRLVYPVCSKAKGLAALTGNLTLTDNAIRIIKNMGYTIKSVAEQV